MTNPNVRLLEVFPGLVLRFEIEEYGNVLIQNQSEVKKFEDSAGYLELLPQFKLEKQAIDFLFPNGYQEPPKLTDPKPEKVEWKEVKE